jgi:hypothetical protein
LGERYKDSRQLSAFFSRTSVSDAALAKASGRPKKKRAKNDRKNIKFIFVKIFAKFEAPIGKSKQILFWTGLRKA